MPENTRAPIPKRRWLPALGVAVIAVAAGVGWFFLKEIRTPAPSAATAAPAPAVGVRLVVQKGVSQSFEFVGRIKAVDKVELRARVEGFLEKVLFREGQDVKAGDLLYQIEKVQFQAQVDQAKANLAVGRGRGRQRPAAIRSATRPVQEASSARSRGRPEPGGAATRAAAKVMQSKAALTPGRGQSRLYRHPLADRRPHRPHRLHPRQSGQSGERRAGDHRQPGSDLRAVSRSACASSRRSARRDARKDGGLAKIEILRAAGQRPGLPASRRLELHRPAGRPADRHADHAGHHPQPRAAADRRPVRHRDHPRAQGGAAAGRAAGRAADRPVRLLRAGRRRPSTRSSSAAIKTGPNHGHRRRHRLGPEGRREGDRRRHPEGAARPGRAGDRSLPPRRLAQAEP